MKDDFLIIAGIAIVGIYIVNKVAGVAGDALGTAQNALGNAANAVNPLNPNNIIAGGANSILQGVTGNQDQTIGTWFYDLLN